MSFDDPNAWAQGATAFKAIFDGLRSAIGMISELRASNQSGSTAQLQFVDQALEKASRAAQIAEAQVAQALGYELCKCEFPPVPMRTVGHIDQPGIKRRGPVCECRSVDTTTRGLGNTTELRRLDLPSSRAMSGHRASVYAALATSTMRRSPRAASAASTCSIFEACRGSRTRLTCGRCQRRRRANSARPTFCSSIAS